jgi:hypothetical protein
VVWPYYTAWSQTFRHASLYHSIATHILIPRLSMGKTWPTKWTKDLIPWWLYHPRRRTRCLGPCISCIRLSEVGFGHKPLYVGGWSRILGKNPAGLDPAPVVLNRWLFVSHKLVTPCYYLKVYILALRVGIVPQEDQPTKWKVVLIYTLGSILGHLLLQASGKTALHLL